MLPPKQYLALPPRTTGPNDPFSLLAVTHALLSYKLQILLLRRLMIVGVIRRRRRRRRLDRKLMISIPSKADVNQQSDVLPPSNYLMLTHRGQGNQREMVNTYHTGLDIHKTST